MPIYLPPASVSSSRRNRSNHRRQEPHLSSPTPLAGDRRTQPAPCSAAAAEAASSWTSTAARVLSRHANSTAHSAVSQTRQLVELCLKDLIAVAASPEPSAPPTARRASTGEARPENLSINATAAVLGREFGGRRPSQVPLPLRAAAAGAGELLTGPGQPHPLSDRPLYRRPLSPTGPTADGRAVRNCPGAFASGGGDIGAGVVGHAVPEDSASFSDKSSPVHSTYAGVQGGGSAVSRPRIGTTTKKSQCRRSRYYNELRRPLARIRPPAKAACIDEATSCSPNSTSSSHSESLPLFSGSFGYDVHSLSELIARAGGSGRATVSGARANVRATRGEMRRPPHVRRHPGRSLGEGSPRCLGELDPFDWFAGGEPETDDVVALPVADDNNCWGRAAIPVRPQRIRPAPHLMAERTALDAEPTRAVAPAGTRPVDHRSTSSAVRRVRRGGGGERLATSLRASAGCVHTVVEQQREDILQPEVAAPEPPSPPTQSHPFAQRSTLPAPEPSNPDAVAGGGAGKGAAVPGSSASTTASMSPLCRTYLAGTARSTATITRATAPSSTPPKVGLSTPARTRSRKNMSLTTILTPGGERISSCQVKSKPPEPTKEWSNPPSSFSAAHSGSSVSTSSSSTSSSASSSSAAVTNTTAAAINDYLSVAAPERTGLIRRALDTAGSSRIRSSRSQERAAVISNHAAITSSFAGAAAELGRLGFFVQHSPPERKPSACSHAAQPAGSSSSSAQAAKGKKTHHGIRRKGRGPEPIWRVCDWLQPQERRDAVEIDVDLGGLIQQSAAASPPLKHHHRQYYGQQERHGRSKCATSAKPHDEKLLDTEDFFSNDYSYEIDPAPPLVSASTDSPLTSSSMEEGLLPLREDGVKTKRRQGFGQQSSRHDSGLNGVGSGASTAGSVAAPHHLLLLWSHPGAKFVEVAGNLIEPAWQRRLPLFWCPRNQFHWIDIHEALPNLCGILQFKFIVDAVWKCDHAYPICDDGSWEHNLNNVCVVFPRRLRMRLSSQRLRKLQRQLSVATLRRAAAEGVQAGHDDKRSSEAGPPTGGIGTAAQSGVSPTTTGIQLAVERRPAARSPRRRQVDEELSLCRRPNWAGGQDLGLCLSGPRGSRTTTHADSRSHTSHAGLIAEALANTLASSLLSTCHHNAVGISTSATRRRTFATKAPPPVISGSGQCWSRPCREALVVQYCRLRDAAANAPALPAGGGAAGGAPLCLEQRRNRAERLRRNLARCLSHHGGPRRVEGPGTGGSGGGSVVEPCNMCMKVEVEVAAGGGETSTERRGAAACAASSQLEAKRGLLRNGGGGPPSGSSTWWPPSVTNWLYDPDVILELELPSGILRKRGSELQLLPGWAMAPHPDKCDTGGADSFYISPDGLCMAIADGVGDGSWWGFSPRLYADELLAAVKAVWENAEHPLHDLKRKWRGIKPSVIARELMKLAAAKPSTYGAATCCILIFDPESQRLGVANLGDSGVSVLRRNRKGRTTTIFRTAEMVHFFNCPYQLSRSPPAHVLAKVHGISSKAFRDKSGQGLVVPAHDSAHEAETFDILVQEGDLVVLATDGLWDNLWQSEISGITSLALAPLEALILHDPELQTDAGDVARALIQAALFRSQDRSSHTPFARSYTRECGMPAYVGGKWDDITVITAWVAGKGRLDDHSTCAAAAATPSGGAGAGAGGGGGGSHSANEGGSNAARARCCGKRAGGFSTTPVEIQSTGQFTWPYKCASAGELTQLDARFDHKIKEAALRKSQRIKQAATLAALASDAASKLPPTLSPPPPHHHDKSG